MRSKNNRTFALLCLLCLGLTACVSAQDVWVSGNPADPDYLHHVLGKRGWTDLPSEPLGVGRSWKNPSGQRVLNLDWHPPEASIVALSDHPEKVTRTGGLFFGGLTPLRTLNFQYYHLGKLKGSFPNLTLVVTNPGGKDALLYQQEGIGKPSLDYFSSGHTNNTNWFQTRTRNKGEFRTIPAGQSVAIFEQAMPLEYVVSGTLGLTQIEGPPLQFAFIARKGREDSFALNNLLETEDVHSRGFYPAPYQVIRRTFRVGSDPLKFAVGGLRQQTFSGVRELRGDYGVTYQTELEIENPTPKDADVKIIFNPRGGAATGSFLVDGELLEVPRTEAFKEHPFHRLTVPKYSTTKLRLETIPEGASSYPVRIVVE
jgi:hypothetical protein